MKDTIDEIIGVVIVSGAVAGSFISGYAIAENKHLRGDIKIMAKMSELVAETHNTIDKNKEKVPEEKTEE